MFRAGESRRRIVAGALRAAAAVVVLAALSLQPAAARTSALQRLREFVDHTHNARADFSQVVIAQNGRKPQVASGTMMFARPGKFRWVYDKPYYQLIVGDGVKLWVYDRDLNQVTVKTLSAAIGSSPMALLAGNNALEKNFILADGGSSDGLDWVDAHPRGKEGSFESLRIGFVGDALKVMELHDNFGQTTVLKFQHMERNLTLPAGMFSFTPPKGADVVGE